MKEEKSNKTKENRLSAVDMAMRLTTLPLHSFLTPGELSLYYILDRFPIRSRFGLADRSVLALLARIMGCRMEECERAADGLIRMGIVVSPDVDTSWMESVIDFPVVYDFCVKVGQHGVGFGTCLRNVTGYKPLTQISSRDFGLAEKAYRATGSVPAHACADADSLKCGCAEGTENRKSGAQEAPGGSFGAQSV